MEDKIYPLNVDRTGETQSGPSSLRLNKKPTFKEWVKERKSMVLVTSAILVAVISGLIYASGLGSSLLGLMDADPYMPINNPLLKDSKTLTQMHVSPKTLTQNLSTVVIRNHGIKKYCFSLFMGHPNSLFPSHYSPDPNEQKFCIDNGDDSGKIVLYKGIDSEGNLLGDGPDQLNLQVFDASQLFDTLESTTPLATLTQNVSIVLKPLDIKLDNTKGILNKNASVPISVSEEFNDQFKGVNDPKYTYSIKACYGTQDCIDVKKENSKNINETLQFNPNKTGYWTITAQVKESTTGMSSEKIQKPFAVVSQVDDSISVVAQVMQDNDNDETTVPVRVTVTTALKGSLRYDITATHEGDNKKVTKSVTTLNSKVQQITLDLNKTGNWTILAKVTNLVGQAGTDGKSASDTKSYTVSSVAGSGGGAGAGAGAGPEFTISSSLRPIYSSVTQGSPVNIDFESSHKVSIKGVIQDIQHTIGEFYNATLESGQNTIKWDGKTPSIPDEGKIFITFYAKSLVDSSLKEKSTYVTLNIEKATTYKEGEGISVTLNKKAVNVEEGLAITISNSVDANIYNLEIVNATNDVVKSLSDRIILRKTSSPQTITWDGKSTSGAVATAGDYKVRYKYSATAAAPVYDPFTVVGPYVVSITPTPSTQEYEDKSVKFSVGVTGGTTPYTVKMEYGNGQPTEQKPGNTSPKVDFWHVFTDPGTHSVKAIVNPSATNSVTKTIQYKVITQTQPAVFDLQTFTIEPSNTQELGKDVKVTVTANGGSGTYDYKLNVDSQQKSKQENVASGTYTFTLNNLTLGDHIITAEIEDSADATKKDQSSQFSYKITSATTLPKCSNGTDDDGDGLIDLFDTGCTNISDNDEQNTVSIPELCTNVVDDDGDGVKNEGCKEADACSDGIDNDVDGKTDTADSDCAIALPPKETLCSNNYDDDGDNKTDSADEDCQVDTPAGDNNDNNDNDNTNSSSSKVNVYNDAAQPGSFNPLFYVTKISYWLKGDAYITVILTDSSGKTKYLLVDEEMQEGDNPNKKKSSDEGMPHYVWWNGTKDNSDTGTIVPDGEYTYTITADRDGDELITDSESGTVTVNSLDGSGQQQDLEDGGTVNTNQNGGTTIQDFAINAMNNFQSGKSAGTGPETYIYIILPVIALAYNYRKSYSKK